MRAHAGMCGLMLLLSGNVTLADESGGDSWRFLVVPYLWIATIDGEAGVKGITADIHASFDDIVQHLDMAVMGQLEAHKGRLGFVVNPIYLDLSADERGPAGRIDLNAGLEAKIVDAVATWEWAPGFELLAGARYTDLDVTLRVRDNARSAGISRGRNKHWTDPIIGARYTRGFDEHWSIGLHGDAGGDGSGSDFVWNALATVGYEVGSSGTIYLGYRVLDYDYEDGSAANRFTFNVRMDGPVLGYGMTF